MKSLHNAKLIWLICFFSLLAVTSSAQSYVVKKKKFDFIVGIDGDFKAAVKAANASSAERFYIFFPNGNYNIGTLTGNENQMTTYSRARTSFIGQSMDKVVIFNSAVNEGISISATLFLDKNADETYMQDLTLQNKSYVQGASANRFVALQDRGNKNVFKRVKLLSTQDTYYSTSGEDKSYWEEGEIHGTVDFICGGGDVLFNKCLIYLEERKNNVIAAPANDGKWGYVFRDCTIDGHPVNSGGYRLGRSWNNKASAVFINTTMKLLPTSAGWGDPMNVVPTRFAEFNSVDANGNVVDLSKRRSSYTKNSTTVNINPILSDYEAAQFTEHNVLGGWLPSNDCRQVSAPSAEINGRTLSWTDSDSALCYFVFKNDVYVANVTENSFELPYDATPTDYFTVRAANAMGGLGEASDAVSVSGVAEPVEPDFIFFYDNGETVSTASGGLENRWNCTDMGAEGYGWAITGRDDKAILYGADIVYEGSVYKTFKNSKGAQCTVYLPKGISAKKVHFIGYSNGETAACLTEVDGNQTNIPMHATTATENYATSPSVVSYKFDDAVCDSFTFTFSTTQVCFILAIEAEVGGCQTSGQKEIMKDVQKQNGNAVFDAFGRKTPHLRQNRIYIKNGMKFMFRN